MKLLACIAFIAFIAIAVFGFCGFSMDHHTVFMNCVRTVAGDFTCSNGIAMGLKHVSIYQSFSQALLIVLVLLLVVVILTIFSIAQNDLFSYQSNNNIDIIVQAKTQFMDWLELSEKRDPLV